MDLVLTMSLGNIFAPQADVFTGAGNILDAFLQKF